MTDAFLTHDLIRDACVVRYRVEKSLENINSSQGCRSETQFRIVRHLRLVNPVEQALPPQETQPLRHRNRVGAGGLEMGHLDRQATRMAQVIARPDADQWSVRYSQPRYHRIYSRIGSQQTYIASVEVV